MGSLRDELLKKGLVDPAKARAVAHEERARQGKLGAKGREEEKAAREAERQRRLDEQREAESARALALQQQRERDELIRRVASILRDAAVKLRVAGTRRFYYAAPDKKIRYVSINDEAAARLERGECAITCVPATTPLEVLVVEAEAALRVEALMAEAILVWNRGGPVEESTTAAT